MFHPCTPSLFFRSTKDQDPRLGEMVQPTSLESIPKSSYVVAGYGDDEGIGLNQGRPGAKEAPDHIRKYFYKMTPSPWIDTERPMVDVGNLSVEEPLKDRHDFLKQNITTTLASSPETCWLGLGGGHDYGYPDGAGFLNAVRDHRLKPLVINFDAHLDVRSDSQGLSSGTPFYRLLEDKTLPEFDFIEVGIQSACNSKAHYEWLLQKPNAHVVDLDEILVLGLRESLVDRFGDLLVRPRPTYISIDIDGFASAYAPGCSQSWATGLTPNEFFPVLDMLKKQLEVRLLGVYEVSPPLDTDDRTSKLAAQILHRFIY